MNILSITTLFLENLLQGYTLLYFYGPSKGFMSPEYFLNFFSDLYTPLLLQKRFKLTVLRLLENTFVSQKIESVYSCPQIKLSSRFLSSPLQAEGNYPLFPSKVFWKSIFPKREGEGYGAENMIKIKIERVLVTSFDKFHSAICNLYFFWFLLFYVII